MTHRKLLRSKAIAIENDLRGTLRNFGLKDGHGGDGEVRDTHQRIGRELAELAVLVNRCLSPAVCSLSSSSSCIAACWLSCVMRRRCASA